MRDARPAPGHPIVTAGSRPNQRRRGPLVVSARRPTGVVTFVVVGTLALSLGLVGPADAAPDYPSWSDVQAAKKDEAATLTAVDKIEGLITGLEATAADYGRVALQKGEAYQIANDALDSATARAKQLQSEADVAAAKATASRELAGQLAAQLARSNNGNVAMGLFFHGDGAASLLERLGAVTKLTEQASGIYEQATLDTNAAQSLTDQATTATKARKRLATKAQDAYAVAESASRDAAAQVAVAQANSTRLYAQLASLKGTTASVERAYLDGKAAEAAQQAIDDAPAPPVLATPAQPSAGTGTTTAPDAPSEPTPSTPESPASSPQPAAPSADPEPAKPEPSATSKPSPTKDPEPAAPSAPNGSAVAGAISFAKKQLGDAYVFAGSGPDVWDCSGLTKAAYAAVGVYIGTHSSTNQYNTMKAKGRLVPLSKMVAGDLLWYSDGGSTSAEKYHVTIYIGNGEMIEAPYPGAVVRIRAVRYGDLVPYAGRPTP